MFRSLFVALALLVLAAVTVRADDAPTVTVTVDNNTSQFGVTVRVHRAYEGGAVVDRGNATTTTDGEVTLPIEGEPGIYRVVVGDATPRELAFWNESFFYFDGETSHSVTFDASMFPLRMFSAESHAQAARDAAAEGDTARRDRNVAELENRVAGNQAAADSLDQALEDYAEAKRGDLEERLGPVETNRILRGFNDAEGVESKSGYLSQVMTDIEEGMAESQRLGLGINQDAGRGFEIIQDLQRSVQRREDTDARLRNDIRDSRAGLDQIRGESSDTGPGSGQANLGNDDFGYGVGMRYEFGTRAAWTLDCQGAYAVGGDCAPSVKEWAGATNAPFAVNSPDKPGHALLITQTTLPFGELRDSVLRFNYSFAVGIEPKLDFAIPFRVARLGEGDSCTPGERTLCPEHNGERALVQWGGLKGDAAQESCRVDINAILGSYKISQRISLDIQLDPNAPLDRVHSDRPTLILGLDVPVRDCLGANGQVPQPVDGARIMEFEDRETLSSDPHFHGGTLQLRGLDRASIPIRPAIGRDALIRRGFLAANAPYIAPLAGVERIEVLRGTASSVYGSDAVAGVINIVSRDTLTAGDPGSSQGFAIGGSPLTLELGFRVNSQFLPEAGYGQVQQLEAQALDLNDCGCTLDGQLNLDFGFGPWLKQFGKAPTGPFFSIGGQANRGGGDVNFDSGFEAGLQVDIFSLGDGAAGQLFDSNTIERDFDVRQAGGRAMGGFSIGVGNSAISPYVQIVGSNQTVNIDTSIRSWDANLNIRNGIFDEKVETTTFGGDVGLRVDFPLADRLIGRVGASAGVRRLSTDYRASSCYSNTANVDCGDGNVFFNEQNIERSKTDVGIAGSFHIGATYYVNEVFAVNLSAGATTTPGTSVDYPTIPNSGAELQTDNAIGWFAGIGGTLNIGDLFAPR